MPKTITNLIREGLPSKIYLLAYNGPISGYKIAEKINGKKAGSVPQTAKIYEWTKKLEALAIISKTKDGFMSNVEPVLCEINHTLYERGISLSELDCYMTSKILNYECFRNLVEFSFYNQENYFKRDIDAAHEIMDVLGFQALLSSVHDQTPTNIRNQSEFDALWAESIKELTPEEIEASPKS